MLRSGLRAWMCIAPAVGALVGLAASGAGGALLGMVAGGICSWAINKNALAAAARGALLGAAFLVLAGPGADWLLSNTGFGPNVFKAIIAGAMIGAVLGIKNHRALRRSGSTPPGRMEAE